MDPLRVFVTDKEFLKLYVKASIGDKYNVKTYRVLKSPKELVGYNFPRSCCVKPTHLSGKVMFNSDKSPIKKSEVISWFNLNHYKVSRESNYKNLKPKIIVEHIIFNNKNLLDYKFFCVNGKVKLIQVDINRNSEHKRLFYDVFWKKLNFSIRYPIAEVNLKKPKNFKKMVEIASKLSTPFDFIRIDLYTDGDKCYVGEITNCHEGADGIFYPADAESIASKVLFGNKSFNL